MRAYAKRSKETQKEMRFRLDFEKYELLFNLARKDSYDIAWDWKYAYQQKHPEAKLEIKRYSVLKDLRGRLTITHCGASVWRKK